MPEEWHRMLALQKRKCMIYSLKEKEGMLRLYHRKESIAEAAYCSYFGLRQKSYRFEAETGGLVLYQNHENHLRMEIAKKQEQKKLAHQNAAQTSTKQEQRVTSETKLEIEKWEEESEELVKEERDMPPEYAGLTREELEKQLTIEIKDKSWEEEKEGLVKITLESFSEDKIVIRKVYNKSSEQGYILRLKDGEVVIYRKDEKEPFEKTGLKEENLSKQDKKILQGGYAVRTEKELYSVLENFSS